MDIPCSKCGYSEIQSNLQLHHLVPRTIGGEDIHGRMWLCKKHHDILHNMLITEIWKYVPEQDREKARQGIKSFSLWWISQK